MFRLLFTTQQFTDLRLQVNNWFANRRARNPKSVRTSRCHLGDRLGGEPLTYRLDSEQVSTFHQSVPTTGVAQIPIHTKKRRRESGSRNEPVKDTSRLKLPSSFSPIQRSSGKDPFPTRNKNRVLESVAAKKLGKCSLSFKGNRGSEASPEKPSKVEIVSDPKNHHWEDATGIGQETLQLGNEFARHSHSSVQRTHEDRISIPLKKRRLEIRTRGEIETIELNSEVTDSAKLSA